MLPQWVASLVSYSRMRRLTDAAPAAAARMSRPDAARGWNGVTLLASLVEVSDRVGAASARLAKVREVAQFVRTL